MMEEWRIVKEFPKYEVSNLGRVRQIRNSKLIFQKDHTQGYKQVTLYSGGKAHYRYVHRLVARAFIPNPSGLPFVNHKDECRTHNWVDNLEWCTPEYNANYGTCRYRMAKKKSQKVKQYTKDGVLIREWGSCIQAEKELGLRRGSISSYINSEFHWEKSD